MKRLLLAVMTLTLLASTTAAPVAAARTKQSSRSVTTRDRTERYNNSKFRAPLMRARTMSTGVIDSRRDVDWRRFRATRSGTATFTVRAYTGNVRVDLYNGNRRVSAASAQKGKIARLSTSVRSGETLYLKVVGTNGATYRIFTGR